MYRDCVKSYNIGVDEKYVPCYLNGTSVKENPSYNRRYFLFFRNWSKKHFDFY